MGFSTRIGFAMKEIFELIEAIPKIKKSLSEAMVGVEPEYLLRGGLAMLSKFVLESALKEGPPSGFGERLHLDPEQGDVLYKNVLTAAITRK